MQKNLDRFSQWARDMVEGKGRTRPQGLTIEKESEKEMRCYDAKKQLSDSGNK